MGDNRSETWLTAAFVKAMRGIGSDVPDDYLREEAQRLAKQWSQPYRVFHNLDYLVNVLNRIDEVDNLTHNPDVLRVAAWYHLAVFVPDKRTLSGERDDNAQASAQLAARQLRAFGVDSDTTHEVTTMIIQQTADDASDTDIATFQDAAVSYLGSIPQDFKKSALQIRDEYPDLSDEEYARARRHALEGILDRSSIYHTPLSDDLEGLARQNLTRECHRLTQMLKTTDDEVDQPDTTPDKHEADTPPPSADSSTEKPTADTGAIIIKAKPKTGSVPQQQAPSTDDDIPTPVLGTPVASEQTATDDDDDEEDYISTLESAGEFMEEVRSKPRSPEATPEPRRVGDVDEDDTEDDAPAEDIDEADIYGDADSDDDTLI